MSDKQFPSERIVSLTASITETLFALGVENRLVGVTDTCDYPAAARRKPNVSCWFEPDLGKLSALEPHLVLGLETAHHQLEPILKREGIHLVLVNPTTVDETLADMRRLGRLLEANEEAIKLEKKLRARLSELDTRVGQITFEKRPTVSRVLDMENNQLIVAGPLSFRYDVISRAGGRNVTGQFWQAYPKVSFTQFRDWDPEMVFFCGYDRHFIPRLTDDPKWRALRAVQSGRVYQKAAPKMPAFSQMLQL